MTPEYIGKSLATMTLTGLIIWASVDHFGWLGGLGLWAAVRTLANAIKGYEPQ